MKEKNNGEKTRLRRKRQESVKGEKEKRRIRRGERGEKENMSKIKQNEERSAENRRG